MSCFKFPEGLEVVMARKRLTRKWMLVKCIMTRELSCYRPGLLREYGYSMKNVQGLLLGSVLDGILLRGGGGAVGMVIGFGATSCRNVLIG